MDGPWTDFQAQPETKPWEDFAPPVEPTTPPGMMAAPSMDLGNRPVLHNDDGTVSTERSFSINEGGKEILLPQIVDGQLVSKEEAIRHYHETGQHMGYYASPEAAAPFAEAFHNRGSASMTPEEMSRTGQTSFEPSSVTAGTENDPINKQGLVSPRVMQSAISAGLALNPATQIPYLAARALAPNVTQGIEQGAGEAASGFTSVQNLPWLASAAVMPEGVAGKVAQTGIAAYFEAQAIRQTPQLWQAYQNSQDPTEKSKLLTQMGVQLGMPAAMMAHVFTGEAQPEAGSPPSASEAPGSAEVPPEAAKGFEQPGESGFTGQNRPPWEDYQAPRSAPPEPQAPNTVRLYHGSAEGMEQAGRDFTTDRQYASDYAAKASPETGGRVWYVDVPEGVVKTHDEYGQPMSRVVVPDEIANQAKPLQESGQNQPSVTPEMARVSAPTVDDLRSAVSEGRMDDAVAISRDLEARLAKSQKDANIDTNEPRPSDEAVTREGQSLPVNEGVEQPSGQFGNTPEQPAGVGAGAQPPTGGASGVGVSHASLESSGLNPQRGAGRTWQQAVANGRNLLNKGENPILASRRLKGETSRSPVDDADVIRAHRELLSAGVDEARAVRDANPGDAGAQQLYDQAQVAEQKFVKEAVKPLGTMWHQIGQGLQGEATVNPADFNSVARVARDAKGKPLTAAEEAPIQRGVTDYSNVVKDGIKDAENVRQTMRKRASGKSMTEAELRADMETFLKQSLKDCVA